MVVGLVGALLLVGGSGIYLAMINPPYLQDESSHVGYTLALRQGDLPSLTTPVPSEGGGEELRLALARPYPFSDPDIHVANNPPFPYLLGIPAAEVSQAIGFRGGALFGIRLLDLAGAVGAVACTYLLGRELGGDDEFVGLVAAGALAGVISVATVSSLANVDGVAFLATTGVTWAMVRVARTRTASHALTLGLWCAAAAAVRPMSAAFAAAAAAVALGLCVRTHGWRSLVPSVARLGLPALVLTGWFYILNIVRYGDPTGSAALFEKYGIRGGPPLTELLASTAPFVQTFDYLVTDIYGEQGWWQGSAAAKWVVALVGLALVGISIGLALRSARSRDNPAGSPRASTRLCPASWIGAAVVGAVPMVLIAQHAAGGGAGHARYLMPVLPIVASALALVASRISRWVAVAAVAGFAVAELSRIHATGHLRYGGPTLFGPALNTPLISQPYRAVSLAVAGLGAFVLVAALASMAITRSDRGLAGVRSGRPVGRGRRPRLGDPGST